MPLRLKILAAIFIALLGLVFVQNYQLSLPGGQAESDVAITDTAGIFAVQYVRPDGQEVTIRKEGSGWLLNNGYEARAYLKNLLFTGFAGMRVKREVSESAREEIRKRLLTSGYKVTVNQGEGVLGKTFYMASNPDDPNSTLYYNPAESETPYIVLVPGFEGSMANLFALPPSEWREKEFFVSSPENLQLVQVDYPDFPRQSFTVSYGKTGFSVSDIERLDTLRLSRYLNAYSYLTINTYIDGGKDSLTKMIGKITPLAIVRVESLRQNRTLEIYEKNGKLWGIIPDQDQLVSLRPEVYNPLLVKREYFSASQK